MYVRQYDAFALITNEDLSILKEIDFLQIEFKNVLLEITFHE